jgi:predicted secreted protein
MRKFILGFATVVLASSAHAGSQYNFKVLGFSADNKTVAFADMGIGDGSGFGIATISVVNVKTNTLIKTVQGVDERESGATESEALKKALAKINLAKYGITAGKNLGKSLVERRPTDYSSTSNTIFSVDSWAEGGSSATVPKYELTIETAPAKAECYDMGEAVGMKLTLTNKEGEATPINRVLQQDSASLPKSRGCAMGYSVTNVIKSGSALVVAVKYSSPGFEGPDTQHMVVTTEAALK